MQQLHFGFAIILKGIILVASLPRRCVLHYVYFTAVLMGTYIFMAARSDLTKKSYEVVIIHSIRMQLFLYVYLHKCSKNVYVHLPRDLRNISLHYPQAMLQN